MRIQGVSNALMCSVFPATLQKAAWIWYTGLRLGSIQTFEQFEKLLTTRFSTSRRMSKTSDSLFTIRQREAESLKDYLDHFTVATVDIPHLNEDIAMAATKGGLRSSRFTYSLKKNFLRTYLELLEHAHKYS